MSDSPHSPMPDTSKFGTVAGNQDSPPNFPAATPPSTLESVRPSATGPGAEVGGRYRLGEEIARGGMGVVYAARDLVLERDVGLKTLQQPPPDGSRIVRRFREEARITGQLQHPGIPPVHDLGTLPDGRPFLAMKLIKGRTLADLLRERSDPSHDRSRFVAIVEQICQAVGYAHAHQVIHRDLKPANVMVGAFGEVQVMDWGLAKVLTDARAAELGPDDSTLGTEIRSLRDADEATRAGTVIGTPAYMPREQAIGAIDQIDVRSDVFGLGAVLCAILTGHPPYVAPSGEEARQMAAVAKLDEAFARLNGCGAEPELVALCKRCLAAEKTDRPRNGEVVAGEVAALRAAADERARQAELDRARAEAEAREQRKRRRVQLALSAAVLLIVAGGGVFVWWQDKQVRERERLEGEQRTMALQRQLEDERREQVRREFLVRNGKDIQLALSVCEEAIRNGDTQKAVAAFDRAEQRLPDGGADGLVDKANRCRTDLAVLKHLDRIDRDRWSTVFGGRLQSLGSHKEVVWAGVLRTLGVVPGTTPLPDAVARINDSFLRERLCVALDRWLIDTHLLTPDDRASQQYVAVKTLLLAVDDDPFRNEFRELFLPMTKTQLMSSPDGLFGIARRRQKLIQLVTSRPETTNQPLHFAILLGEQAEIPFDLRKELLQQALHKWPGNLGVLMSIASGLPLEQREPWYRAAVAAHPGDTTGWQGLGAVLRAKGALDEAVDCFRRVTTMEPNDVGHLMSMEDILRVKGDTQAADEVRAAAVRLDARATAMCLWARGIAARGLPGQQPDPVRAKAALLDAITIDPDLAMAHLSLGQIYATDGDLDSAIIHLRHVIRISRHVIRISPTPGKEWLAKDDVASGLFLIGSVLTWKQEYQEAREAFRQAVEQAEKPLPETLQFGYETEYYKTHYCLVILQLVTGDRDGAEKSLREAARVQPKRGSFADYGIQIPSEKFLPVFQEATRLSPDLLQARYKLGCVLLAKGDRVAAIRTLTTAYQDLVRFGPLDGAGYLALGRAMLDCGEADEAIRIYSKALELNPDNGDTHYHIADAKARKGDRDGAIAAYREVVRLDPTATRAHAQIGAGLGTKGDLKGAANAFREAIRVEPMHAGAHLGLGTALYQLGDLDAAIAALQQAIRLEPNNPASYDSLGIALSKKGDLTGAVRAYREVIRLDPASGYGYAALGGTLLTMSENARGNVLRAISAFEESIRRDPTNARTHYQLGKARWAAGDLPGAIDAYRQSLRWKSSDPDVHSDLGIAFDAVGSMDAAVTAFQEALRLDPKNPVRKQNVTLALKRKAEREVRVTPPVPVAPPPRPK